MTRKYRFLFVAYRWGEDLTGGAEIHHRRLVQDLLELGHDVEVWTTTGRGIEPVAHWAVQWHEGYEPGLCEENGIRVRRFPLKRLPRQILALGSKALQRRTEKRIQADTGLQSILEQTKQGLNPGVYLFDGWHHPETTNESVQRWSMQHARILVAGVSGDGVLCIRGSVPHETFMTVGKEKFHLSGDFEISTHVSGNSNIVEVPVFVRTPFRPARDHRTLGILADRILWRTADNVEFECDLWRDHRALGRLAGREWCRYLLDSMDSIENRWSILFDFLRGPRSSTLRKALAKLPEDFDYVIAANLPWSIIPMVAKHCPLPMLAMPLWHIEDDYYYWKDYVDALRRAKLVMANTPYAAEQFYTPMGVHARFVGPGVLPPGGEVSNARNEEREIWKDSLGITEDEAVVLCVCRKSPEKRYDLIVDAIGELRKKGKHVRMVLIGPDGDRRPLPDHVIYPGRVNDEELEAAYRNCDVFVLMSETESFGMVLAEAWMRGKPVIANRACGPAASLIHEGEDGLLASDSEELARLIADLTDNPGRAHTMGKAGREKALREYTQRAATERLLAAIDELPAAR